MKTISIGDIHGIDAWKQAVDGTQFNIDNFDKVIFVGDYVDSFNVSAVIQKHNLQEIINLKKKYPDKVVLLLGNHDIQYMDYPYRRCPGFQGVFQIDYTQIFRENRNLFQAAYQVDNHLWSHAGVHYNYYIDYMENYHALNPNMSIADMINQDYAQSNHWVFNIGWLRGGVCDVGGPFWLDRRNLWKNPLDGYHQVVGHSRISSGEIMHISVNQNTSATCIDVLEDSSPKFYVKNI